MLATTREIIKAGLKADPTIQLSDRNRLLLLLSQPEESRLKPPPNRPKVLPRRETAERFNRSLRYVDRLAQMGVLRKVKLPGRKRAIGFAECDVEALILRNPEHDCK